MVVCLAYRHSLSIIILVASTSVHVCLSYTGVGLNLGKFSLKQRKPFILKFVLKSNFHLKGSFAIVYKKDNQRTYNSRCWITVERMNNNYWRHQFWSFLHYFSLK